MYKAALGATPFNTETTWGGVGVGVVQWADAAVPQHKYYLEPPRSSASGIKPMYYAWSRSQFRGLASVETADKSSVLIPITKIGYSGEKLTVGLLWLALLPAVSGVSERKFQQLRVGR